VNSDLPQEMEGFPMRGWDINIYLVGPDGDEISANCYEKATYHLHESFGKRQKQVVKNAPFKIQETGWGEFDMQITLTPVGAPKGGDHTISHDLNFLQERYEATHNVVCP
jgi:transcription initiation factor IIF auxiliary subunit